MGLVGGRERPKGNGGTLQFIILIVVLISWTFSSVITCQVPVCMLSHVWLCNPVDFSPPSLLSPGGFPGKSTGMSCHSFFQEIFLIQGLNPHLLLWQVDSLPLSHLGSPTCQVVQNLPAIVGATGDKAWSLSWEDPWEEKMATHSSILAWKIQRMGASGGLYSPWGHKESDTAEATEHETHQICTVYCKSVISH